MASKLICDSCGAEINPKSSRVFMQLTTGDSHELYDLCCFCAFHLNKWLDGEEKLVDVKESI